ncbi:MAG: penicillin-binding transpeptidase domain-containing protein [Pyrinomonadaceae bacterium]
MTQTFRTSTRLLVAVIFSLSFIAADGQAAQRKKAKKPAAAPAKKKSTSQARNSRAEKGRAKASPAKSAKDTHSAKKNSRTAKDSRKPSRRERLAQARREAAERRRRAEAARRAELARRAAIARQRAIDQSFRQEVAANVQKDDPTGEDLEVRRAAVAALGNYAGSVVVMDPKTGRVYTVVNQDWGVRRGFKPCSTIKLVTGLAGLEEGVIEQPQQQISTAATLSQFDLTDALAYSHNGFFQRVGSRVGFDRLASYARQFGLGERTGINHANEFAGRIPLFENAQTIQRMSSHGDSYEVTPVQLATLASLFANGGTLLVPHLPRTPEENVKFKTEVRRQLNIPPDVLRRMLPGMIGAVNYGSGKKSYDPAQTIAGKTGTCIGAGGQWVGLFTSYAPVEDPRLAIAVITRGSDSRAHVPAAIAGQIYRALNGRFGKRGIRTPVALPPDLLAPRPKVDPSKIADDEDEADAADTADTGGAAAAPLLNPTGTNNTNVKPTLQPIQTRPTGVTTTPPAKAAPAPGAKTNAPKPGEGRPRRVLMNTPEIQ